VRRLFSLGAPLQSDVLPLVLRTLDEYDLFALPDGNL
jgi:hypothetical protein